MLSYEASATRPLKRAARLAMVFAGVLIVLIRHPNSGSLKSKSKERGAAAVEFALVLPLLLTLLLGVWDFGRLIETNQVLSNAAREGGRQISTSNTTAASVQTTVTNYITRAGFSTTGMTLTLTNVTSTSRNDPTTANQLDQYQLVVTLPSNNVRLIILGSLLGVSTLRNTTTWLSMADIPLSLPASIPVS